MQHLIIKNKYIKNKNHILLHHIFLTQYKNYYQ
jgi:hypothetical protein